MAGAVERCTLSTPPRRPFSCKVSLDSLHDFSLLHSLQFESIRHKALRKFAETGSSRGLPAGSVVRLRNMLAYLAAIEATEELEVPPNFGAHRLTGDRKSEWSLTVTRNWRMTLRVNTAGAIEDLDLEDYH